jgi:hypothetical protein
MELERKSRLLIGRIISKSVELAIAHNHHIQCA